MLQHERKQTLRVHLWKLPSQNVIYSIFLILRFVQSSSDTLRWRHNDHAGVSNHQPPGCLLNRLFRRKSKKTSKLRVTGLCAGNSPGTGEFSAQMASYAENVSIWWRHHVIWSDTIACLSSLSLSPEANVADSIDSIDTCIDQGTLYLSETVDQVDIYIYISLFWEK